MRTFSLITFNICRHYEWNKKSTQLISTLHNKDADILCLQEILYNPKIHRLNQHDGILLEKATSYAGVYSLETNYYKSDHKFLKKNGVGTLFKPDITPKLNYANVLPNKKSNATYNFSSFLCTYFEIESKPLWIINTHLGLTHEARKKHWNIIDSWIKTYTQPDDNLIFCGDLNTNNKKGIDINEVIINAGFKDSWKELNTIPCLTYHSSEWWVENFPNSYEAKKIIKKRNYFEDSTLDYIFFKGPDLKINNISTFDLSGKVSDHLGVYSTFII